MELIPAAEHGDGEHESDSGTDSETGSDEESDCITCSPGSITGCCASRGVRRVVLRVCVCMRASCRSCELGLYSLIGSLLDRFAS